MAHSLGTVVASLHRETVRQMFRFALSTVASASATLGLPVVLHELAGVEPQVAVAISQCSVLVLNFVMIRGFVFRSRRTRSRDLLYYGASAAVFRGLEYLLFLLLFEAARMYYVAALVCTLGASTILKFGWYRLVFTSSKQI
jgi:putative flippase GtrA